MTQPDLGSLYSATSTKAIGDFFAEKLTAEQRSLLSNKLTELLNACEAAGMDLDLVFLSLGVWLGTILGVQRDFSTEDIFRRLALFIQIMRHANEIAAEGRFSRADFDAWIARQ